LSKYTVYHTKHESFAAGVLGDEVPFPEGFEKVAVVETASGLESVWAITQHVESDWTKNEAVQETFMDRCRSTSVGDVIVDEEGKRFRCAFVGWEEF